MKWDTKTVDAVVKMIDGRINRLEKDFAEADNIWSTKTRAERQATRDTRDALLHRKAEAVLIRQTIALGEF